MRKMMNILFLLTLCDQTVAYATCPGDWDTYIATGLPEQWPCHGACISVDEACDGECFTSVACGYDDKGVYHRAASCSQCGSQCGGDCRMEAGECVYKLGGVAQDSVFQLNNNKTCTRKSQWFTCDSSTGSTGGYWPCTPGSPGCQPLHDPCGGKCPGGGKYNAFWKCPNEQRCILSALVCSGLGPFCSDGSDQMNNTCFMTGITGCPRVHSWSPVSRSQHCKGAGRHQCVQPVKGMDCLDASDKDKNTEELVSGNNTDKVSELVKKLPTCTTDADGSKGLKCLNNECIAMSVWCSPTFWQAAVCKLQADPLVEVSDVRHAGSVCMDKEFWEGRTCDNELWQRCSGTHPGQCYYKTDQCISTTGAYGTCQDSSHRICHSNKTYRSESGVKSTGEKVCSGEEMFRCQSGDTCVDNKLVCNGTPQCPDGSDEDSKKCKCPWILSEIEGPDLLKNRNVSAATVQCLDNRFPGLNIFTCAVRCDDRRECLGGEDEKGCQENKVTFRTTVGCVVFVFVVASIFVVHRLAPRIQRKIDLGEPFYTELAEPLMNHESTTKLIHLICSKGQGDGEEERKTKMLTLLASLHQGTDFYEKIKIVSTSIQLHPSKSEIERRNQLLFDLEHDYHEGDGHEICIKNHMDTNKVTEAILKGTTPGMVDKLLKCIDSHVFYCCQIEERFFKMSRWFSYNRTIQIMAAIFEMAFYYIDLLKDMAVVYVMSTLVITNNLEYEVFLVTFNGILLLLMIFSVVASILLTSIFLSSSHPGVELQLFGVKKSSMLKSIRLLTFVLSLFIPTTLIYQLTRQRFTLKSLENRIASAIATNQGRVYPADIIKLHLQKRIVNLLDFLTYFKQKNDLVLEVTIQTSVNVVMILVVRSAAESLTETGLQALFSDSTAFLVLGLVMSIKKIITSNLALIAASKNEFLPFTGKLLKAISYLVTSLVRICCVSLFFGLPLGILNILIHTHSLTKYNLESRSLIYDVTVAEGKLVVMRMNDTYTVTHYTQLTGIRFCWYGVIFLLGVIFHIIVVTLVKKCVFSDAFSKLPKMEKFLHILHTIAFPEACVDWDYGTTGSLETYRRQWEAFKQENIFMVALHTVENLLMAVPVLFICSNVVSYHRTLPYTTDLEEEAYNTARHLRIVWPVIVLLLPILQGLLLLAYNKYGHPWKIIFAKFGDTVIRNNTDIRDTENTEIRELAEDQEQMVEELEASDEIEEEEIYQAEENRENGELVEDPKEMVVAMKEFSDIEISFAPAATESISEV